MSESFSQQQQHRSVAAAPATDFSDIVANSSTDTPLSVTSAETAAANAVAIARARLLPTVTTGKRMQQLFEENDHKRCSEGNRKALLAEHLEQLRAQVKTLEADDWKFAAPVASVVSTNFLGGARMELGSPPEDLELQLPGGAAGGGGR